MAAIDIPDWIKSRDPIVGLYIELDARLSKAVQNSERSLRAEFSRELDRLEEEAKIFQQEIRRELKNIMNTFEENEARLKADIQKIKDQETAEEASEVLTKEELADAKSQLVALTAERDQLQKDKDAGAQVDSDREQKLQSDITELETLINAQATTSTTPVDTTPTTPVDTTPVDTTPTAPVDTTPATPVETQPAPPVPDGSTDAPAAGGTVPAPPADQTTVTTPEPAGDSVKGGTAPTQTDGGVTTVIPGNAGDATNVPGV